MCALRVKVQLSGLDQYIENLQKVGANIDAIVSEAIEESAKIIEKDIQEWADKHKRTGAVSEGVDRSDVQREGDNFFVEVGVNGLVSNDESVAWHAVFIEYGTPKKEADPGIWPAFNKNKAKVKKIQKAILMKGGVPVE